MKKLTLRGGSMRTPRNNTVRFLDSKDWLSSISEAGNPYAAYEGNIAPTTLTIEYPIDAVRTEPEPVNPLSESDDETTAQ